jgi:competence protein ComEC
MNIWNQAPLVRLILPFLAGILMAIYIPAHIDNFYLIILPYLAIIAAFIYIPPFKITYKKSWIFGLIANLLLFAIAYQLTISKTEKFRKDHFMNFLSSSQMLNGRIIESPIEKERSYKMTFEATSVSVQNEWKPCSGKIMLYLKKDLHSASIRYGDELIINSRITEVSGEKNPGEFNYKRFLAFHNIYHQSSADSSHWLSTGTNSGNVILKYSFELRDQLLRVLSENNISGDEFSVGAALMLGYCDLLDADIISAYSSTGALHVLSVSGLHVAIVYIVFNFLLCFLDKIKYGNVVKAIMLILLLWFYSALTGLSPSVLRASTMFSFIIIAKAFNRYTNIYNTLAASAFLLLAINPFLVMEVGFQLSYLAVIGIVYLQPKIYQWFQPETWIVDQVWTITAVSIAAQIATFPLGLLYFHQFPNYFLLSNFIVIPVSTVIIYLGIGLFAAAKVKIISVYLAIGFKWSVWFLNESVKLIEKWPNALLQGISISILETWFLYSMIILLVYYFIKRKIQYLYLALTFIIFILCSQIIEQAQQFNQNKLVIYSIPKTRAIDVICGKENVLITDSALANDQNSLLFHVKHNWWDLGIDRSKIITGNYSHNDLCIKNNIIVFKNTSIVILDNSSRNINKTGELTTVDYVVLSKNSKVKIQDIMEVLSPKQIIFDSANSLYTTKKWAQECTRLHLEYYSVPDSGAFIADL